MVRTATRKKGGRVEKRRETEREQRNGFRKMLLFPRDHPLDHPPALRRLPPLRLLQDRVLHLLAADDSGVLAGHHLRYLRSCRSRSRTLPEILLPTPCVADLHRTFVAAAVCSLGASSIN